MTTPPIDEAPLDSEPIAPRPLRPWYWAIASFAVGYPLSVGPVGWLVTSVDAVQRWQPWIDTVYLPLQYLYFNVPLVRAFYDWYLALFGLK